MDELTDRVSYRADCHANKCETKKIRAILNNIGDKS